MKKTLENLTKAFVGESQARNRYSYYAKVAKKEGYEQIAGIFLETAEQEKVHAKRLFEHIQELKEDQAEIIIETGVPTVYGTTKENLQAAIEGENHEYTEMYPGFATVAEEEGLQPLADRFRSIAKSEQHHEQRYKKLLTEVEFSKRMKKKFGSVENVDMHIQELKLQRNVLHAIIQKLTTKSSLNSSSLICQNYQRLKQL